MITATIQQNKQIIFNPICEELTYKNVSKSN